ncbi:Macrolide export protein MacA [compost metagenome]
MVLYTVLLDVDNPDNALMAEMTTQVFFVSGRASNVLTVPVAALDDDGSDERMRIAQVLDANGKIEQRQVRTGLSDRLRVQVLEGLNEGERLLIGAPAASGG